MKEKVFAIVLSVILILALIPANAFAGTVATTLEAEFSDGHFGNNCTIQAGTSEIVQFYMGEDDGKNFVIEKKISAKEKDYKVYDGNFKETDLIKLEALSNGKMKITPSESIKVKLDFTITYVGSEFELNSNNAIRLTVTLNTESKDNFKKVETSESTSESNKKSSDDLKNATISKLTLKSSNNGIEISFKREKNVEGYEIYRSAKKEKGFKMVADVSRNTILD